MPGKPRLLDRDPLTGVSAWFHDLGNDEYAVVQQQDVDPILEINQALRNQVDENQRYNGLGKNGGKEVFHLEATIPAIWLAELMAKTSNLKDKNELKRLLNDKRYRHLRTTNRKL